MKTKILLSIVLLWILGINSMAQNNLLDFAGDNDYISITGLSSNGFSGITIEAWVYPHSFNDPVPDARISNVAGHNDASSLLRIGDSHPGELEDNDIPQFVVTTGSGNKKCTGTTQMLVNKWYHIAGTYDGSNLRIYVNGILEKTVAHTGNITNGMSTMEIGGSGTERYFDGLMDEVRIWNDARTQDEIRQNMYREIISPGSDLVAYYKLNETTGTTAIDTKGSFNGTLTNMSGNEWQTSPALFGPKQCLGFDGTDDYVALESALNITGTNISIEAWIYPTDFKDEYFKNTIIGNDYWGGANSEGYVFRFGGAGGDLDFTMSYSGGYNWAVTIATGVLTLNTWQHVAATYDGSDVRLYVNGVEVYSSSHSTSILSSSQNPRIGDSPGEPGGRLMNGSIDELRIWNDVRTPLELRENMCRMLDVTQESNLAAYYTFDNVTGTSLQDISGNDIDGTWQGSGGGSYTIPSWTASSAFNTWLNTTNSNWRTTSNWSLGSYPTTGHNTGVYYYGGASVQPSYDWNIECRNLVIGASADITFSNPLDVDENFLVNSDFDIPDNCGMRVDKAVITSGKTLTVRPGGMIDIYSGIVNEGTFLLESTSSGTGSVVADGTYSGSGSYEIQRYIAQWTDANHGWHFLSSPVSAQAIQPGFVSDPPTVNEDFYSWDEPTNYWINTKAGDGSWNSSFESTFTVGKGYLVAYGSDQTKSFSGTWNNSNVSITNLTHTLTSENRGWHLLGNPFPCGVIWTWDIEWDLNWQQQNIGSTAKIWQESSASYTDIDNGEMIPPMQGFMVYVAENQTGSLIIPKALRSHETDVWYKSTGVNTLKLTVHDVEYHTTQETVIRFIPEASQSYDIAYDCWYLPGYAPQFYTQTEGKAVSTNGLPELSESIQIPLYFIKNEGTQFYIRIEGTDDLDPDLPVFLTDLQTQTTHNLTNEPIYSFTATEGDDPGRFLLHFSTVGIGEKQFTGSVINILAWNGGNTLHISNPEQLTGQFAVFDMTCKPVLSGILDGESEQSYSHNLPGGLYVVCFRASEGVVSRKVLVTY
ncbi:MAG: LamG domain-containing protein [Bacteroidetes bacterium]|nr:LamG domain-containing protein [Bacteroidota bacterium]